MGPYFDVGQLQLDDQGGIPIEANPTGGDRTRLGDPQPAEGRLDDLLAMDGRETNKVNR